MHDDPARLLPMADAPAPVRSDASRNREAVLAAAQALVAAHGADAVTMDAVAACAGVGKGTVFRGYGSRELLMAALVDYSEAAWQGAVISGPPPLGPGADPWERLVAFGRSRLETTLAHADVLRAAGRWGSRSGAAYSFTRLHARVLLADLGVTGDLRLLSTALMAPLEVAILDQEVRVEGLSPQRVGDGWVDLARRVVGR